MHFSLLFWSQNCNHHHNEGKKYSSIVQYRAHFKVSCSIGQEISFCTYYYLMGMSIQKLIKSSTISIVKGMCNINIYYIKSNSRQDLHSEISIYLENGKYVDICKLKSHWIKSFSTFNIFRLNIRGLINNCPVNIEYLYIQ